MIQYIYLFIVFFITMSIRPRDICNQELESYTVSKVWRVLVYLAVFLTAGLLRLLFHWLPHWYIRATHRKCSLAEATTLLLKVALLLSFLR